MSDYGRSEVKDTIENHVLHYLEKPIEAEELGRVIMTALDRKMLLSDVSGPVSDLDQTGGFLRGISVGSFLQMIEMEEKTCLLEVGLSDGKRGLFYFEAGELYDALCGSLIGKEAALKMIPMERPKIRFLNPPKKKIKRRINEPLMGIIMEAMRRKDESSENN